MVKRIARLGGLLAVLTLVVPVAPANAGGGGGGCHGQVATSARTTRIGIESNCFTPTLARVPVGVKVTWINEDPYAHTVTGASGSWGSYAELLNGKTSTMRFTRAGAYPYFCAFHPGMVGTVLVGDANGPGTANVLAGGSVVEEVNTEQAQPIASKAPARRRTAWPAIALPVGTVAALAGFGFGRRARAPISR
jgi:plastocyanin